MGRMLIVTLVLASLGTEACVEQAGDAIDWSTWTALDGSPAWTSDAIDSTWGIAWGDVDGDGDLDLAVANQGQENRVYLNDAGSLETAATWTSFESESSVGVAWGDVDGDGDLDLAVANLNQVNRVYENQGGSLDLVGDYWTSAETDPSLELAWADPDCDGDLDLAVANHDSTVNRIYVNQGSMLEATASWSTSEAERSYGVRWADSDGDGDIDLWFANRGDPDRGHETSGCALPPAGATWASAASDNTGGLAFGDVDGDGHLELCEAAAVGNPNGSCFDNTSGSVATAATWWSAASGSGNQVDLGDLDGDGDLEVAVSSEGGTDRLSVYEPGSGSALDLVDGVGSGIAAYGVALADWDGDGALEVAIGVDGQANLAFDDDAAIGPALEWETVEADDTRDVALGDWDGDGDLDLAVVNHSGEKDRVYVNVDGSYQYDPVSGVGWESDENESTWSVAWGDVDGDGDLDLAISGDASVRVHLNIGGSPPLETVASWSVAPGSVAEGLAFGDWDGDGDLDLAVAQLGANLVYRNAGTGLESTPVWTAGEVEVTRGVAWQDVDGDGDLDLAAANSPDANRVYFNDGTCASAPGTCLTSGWVSAEAELSRRVAWGDWDGDGDPDLAVANNFANRVYQNDGNCSTSPSTCLASAWVSTAANESWSVGWVDWEDDGDLDLVFGNQAADDQVYVQTPWGLPTTGTFGLSGETSFGLAFGDLDGDGDVDGAFGYRNAANALYRNHRLTDPNLPNNPTYPVVDSPSMTQVAASGIHSPEVLTGSALSIPFAVFDAESDSASSIRVEYSLLGGGQWLLATLDGEDNPAVGPFAASPDGTNHTLDWDMAADLTPGSRWDDVRVRVVVEWQNPTHIVYPIQQGELAAVSPGFRVQTCQDDDGDGVTDCDGDCDDADPANFPSNPETCDGQDNNCLAGVDETFDGDGDGVTTCGDDGVPSTLDDDCDDTDPDNFPGNPEICDGQDNDCDGSIPADETDDDGDGASECNGDCDDLSAAMNLSDADGDGTSTCGPDGLPNTADDDCDDSDPANYPGNAEVCDGQDNDCNGSVSAEESDDDLDGFTECGGDCDDLSAAMNLSDGDGDGTSTCGPDGLPNTADDDCDDADPANYPTNTEVCDGQDNDCSGAADADPAGEIDADADGALSCVDCDDADSANYPTNTEVCDGQDNDCEADVDEGFDTDGDGVTTCGPDGTDSTADDDCDDGEDDVYPGAPEDCDAIDSDCDGSLVDGYADLDGDGLPDCEDDDVDGDGIDNSDDDCEDGATGWTSDSTTDNDGDGCLDDSEDLDDDDDGTEDLDDCVPLDPSVYPGAEETIDDGIDQDCNGVDTITCYVDVDGDGFGSTTTVLEHDDEDCTDDEGQADNADDCDDGDATLTPADEDGDGVSSCAGDCDDGDAGLNPSDVDGDGVSTCDDDCDDANPATFPGNPEVCDGQDNDCDGLDDYANDGLAGSETDFDSDGVFDCLDGAVFLGGCACSGQLGGRSGSAAATLPLVLLLAARRRRERR